MEDREIEDKMMELIPKTGKPIGNITLFNELKKKIKDISDDAFWRVRNNLIQIGKLSKARGKGGAVYLIDIPPADKKDEVKQKVERIKEHELYDPFLQVIKTYWVKENDIDDYITEKTANQGKRKTGGRWTRPDVTLISMKNYQYIFGKIMEVITFEIKPKDDYGIESVFETASQSVFAHKSYLCIHVSGGKPETEEFDRILRQCDLFGVGLIVFDKPDDWETYETIVEPKRREPDPYEVNMFIKQQLSEKNKEELSRKLK